MNLGNALWRLGERESGTAHLDEAVAAYRAALEERTRERVPGPRGEQEGNFRRSERPASGRLTKELPQPSPISRRRPPKMHGDILQN